MNEMCINREDVEKVVSKEIAIVETSLKGELALLSQKLDAVAIVVDKTLIQATKTNGRVTDHDLKIQRLENSDEIQEEIAKGLRELQDKAIASNTVIKTVWQIGGIISAIIALSITVLGFILTKT